jgi:hypothetical protein
MFVERCRRIARHLPVIALAALFFQARSDDVPLMLEANAINLSNVGRPGMQRLELKIERWSTDAETDRLRDALTQKGSDSLLKSVRHIKPRAGFIRTSTSLGWNLQYARRIEEKDGGYRVVFVTDRPMRFAEVANNLRSAQYEFMMGEIRFPAEGGKGEGKLVPRAKIRFDRKANTIEIEDYATQPVRLTEVRATTEGKS